MKDRELEIKFYLLHPEQFRNRMAILQAEPISPRTAEWNIRFDDVRGNLAARGQVLRLRKDERIRLTFKGPSELRSDVTSREELEVEVSDFDTTFRILSALGYQVVVNYEKFRTTWHYQGAEIVLDELPMGIFCEIEGQSAEQIEEIASNLHLNWEYRVGDSYLTIFRSLKNSMGFNARNLTFADMRNTHILPADLAGIRIYPADISSASRENPDLPQR